MMPFNRLQQQVTNMLISDFRFERKGVMPHSEISRRRIDGQAFISGHLPAIIFLYHTQSEAMSQQDVTAS
jgi:hypothetical protein